MNGFMAFLGRSLRGVRLIEAFALVLLLVMVLGVYLAKASAGRERGDITSVEGQIADEQRRTRLLQAEVAHLEEPERIERLAGVLGLGPVSPKHERMAGQLSEIAREGLTPEKVSAKAGGATTQNGYQEPAGPVALVQAASGKAGGVQ